MAESIRDRFRSGEDGLARTARAARRGVAKARAIALNRSIPQFMDEVVASVPKPPRRVAPTPQRSARPRIASFSTYPIHPRRGGGPLRGWYLSEGLGGSGAAEVRIVSLTTKPAWAGVHQLSEWVTEECLLIDSAAERRETDLRLVTADVSITDIASGLMWPGIDGFVRAAESALEGASAAIAVQPYLVDAIETLAGGLPLIYDSHNDEVELKSTILPNETVGGRWLSRWVDDFERRCCEDAALVTATTDTDLHTLGLRYRISAPTDIIPNGVDTDAIEFVTGGERASRRQTLDTTLGLDGHRPVALFVGSGHLPNIEAGRIIVDIAKAVPGIDFVLAGEHSTRLGGDLPNNVHALGGVSNELLDLLLASSDVALNPMGAGSGSNLKLFTYLAAGIPVLATPMGARGVDAEAAGVMTATFSSLAGALEILAAADPEERANAGRRYVEQHCDWRVIGERFSSLVHAHALP